MSRSGDGSERVTLSLGKASLRFADSFSALRGA